MNENHLQGYVPSSIKYGLLYGDELVMIVGFVDKQDGEYELSRLSSKNDVSVVGGFSKLLNCFIKNFNPRKIHTYADRRYSVGNVYVKNGFKLIGITKPNYFYIKNNKIHSRQQFQKHKLSRKLYEFDCSLTEAQNMFNNRYRRIWDCGHLKFVWTNIIYDNKD